MMMGEVGVSVSVSVSVGMCDEEGAAAFCLLVLMSLPGVVVAVCGGNGYVVFFGHEDDLIWAF